MRDGTLRAAERSRLWRLVPALGRDQYQLAAMTEEAHAQAARLLFSLGVMNLLGVAALSAFILVEKVAPADRCVNRLSGARSPHGFHTTGTGGSGR